MRLLIGLWFATLCIHSTSALAVQDTQRFMRFQHDGQIKHGRIKGDRIEVLSGDYLIRTDTTGKTLALADVTPLPPTKASKVFAVGMNFSSHLASNANSAPPLFLKLPSSLTGHASDIVLPDDARNVHFEGELVLVIAKQAKNVSVADAPAYIFGVTAGNDLSERGWQGRDLQWMRAKASDGFGPVGPVVATGLDFNNVLLTTRLNGKVMQQESTKNMIHKPAKVVSYLSQYFTLEPGDLIFMGTPGRTKALQNDDVISVEIEGIGLLENKIVQN